MNHVDIAWASIVCRPVDMAKNKLSVSFEKRGETPQKA